MDPLTHTLAGAVLARSGLGRGTPLAAMTAMIAANAPDVDIVAMLKDEYFALAFRRGITHGLPALMVWPFVITAAFLLFDHFFRRRRHPAAPPARPRTLLLISAVAVATHPALDWLNNYGMRWLLPFSGRWSYGDAVFIIDPWIWLLLGAAVFLAYEWSKRALVRWGVLAVLATAAVVATGAVPLPAKLIWLAGIIGIIALQRSGWRVPTRGARVLGGVAAAYMLLLVLLDPVEARIVRRHALRAGVADIRSVMVAPVPANPFGSDIIVATPDHYRTGSFRWLPRPNVRLDTAVIAIGKSPMAERAARAGPMRDYLVWSRYPFFTVGAAPEGRAVGVSDARYSDRPTGSLSGLTVILTE